MLQKCKTSKKLLKYIWHNIRAAVHDIPSKMTGASNKTQINLQPVHPARLIWVCLVHPAFWQFWHLKCQIQTSVSVLALNINIELANLQSGW